MRPGRSFFFESHESRLLLSRAARLGWLVVCLAALVTMPGPGGASGAGGAGAGSPDYPGVVPPSRVAADGVKLGVDGHPFYATFSICAIDPASGQSGVAVTTRVP